MTQETVTLPNVELTSQLKKERKKHKETQLECTMFIYFPIHSHTFLEVTCVYKVGQFFIRLIRFNIMKLQV